MWSPQSRLKLLEQHLYRNFNHRSDVSLRYRLDPSSDNYVRLAGGGPMTRREPFKKIIILDFDGVFNKSGTPSAAKYYIMRLLEKNDHLRSKSRRVLRNFAMLESMEDPFPYAEALNYDFMKSGMTRSVHKEACVHAASMLEMVNNYDEAVDGMRNRAYDPHILSASPTDLILQCGSKTGIGAGKVSGTTFRFNESGYFAGMDLNMGRSRSESRDRIMRDSVSSNYGVEILVDDNPLTGRRVAKSGWNHVYMWLSESARTTDNVNISLVEAREDFTVLLKKLKQLERGLAVMVMMDESEYRRLVELCHEVSEYGYRALSSSGSEFESEKIKMTSGVREYLRGMKGLFPSKLTGALSYVKTIETEREEQAAKVMIEYFVEKFRSDSIECQMEPSLFPG